MKKKRLLSLFICFFMFLQFFTPPNIVKAASGPTISYSFSSSRVTAGQTFDIIVNLSNATNLYGASLDFKYDPSLIQVVSVTKGNLLPNPFFSVPTNNTVSGELSMLSTLVGSNAAPVSGSDSLFRITVKSLKVGTVNLNTTSSNSALSVLGSAIRIKLSNNSGTPISYSTESKNLDILSPAPPLNPGTYDDTNSNVAYVGSWIKEYNPSYNNGSAMISNSSGDYVTFRFNGTGLKWHSLTGVNIGHAKVTIDSTTYTFDNYSSSTAFKKVVFEKDGLSPGEHVVKIEVTNVKNSSAKEYYQVIDSLEVLNTPQPQPLTAGIYDENNSAISYVGSWFKEVNSGYKNGSANVSNSSNSYVTFKFNGTGFKWNSLSAATLGIAKVTIDSNTYNVDSYSASTAFNKVAFVKDGLTPGVHTVKIEVTNTKNNSSSNYYQVIDSLEVLNTPPTPSQVLSPGTYDNNNSALNYVGSWIKEVNGSYKNGDALISNSNGDYVIFKFNGTGFKWHSLAAASLGNAKVTIDSNTYTIDSYSSSVVFNKVAFAKDGLTPGEHTVKIEVTNTKNSSSTNYYQVIDAIEVLNTATTPSQVLSAGTYDDTNSAFSYVGSWIKEVNAGYKSGSAMISNSNGNYMTFKFNGTGFKWISLSAASLGNAKVTIDSNTYTVDNYSASTVFNKVAFEKDGLTPGEHTVKIEVTNTKNSSASNYYEVIDGIQVLNTPVNPSKVLNAGTYEENNSAFAYVGNWIIERNNNYSNDASLISNNIGDYMTFKFNGTGFKWNSISAPSLSIAKVTIDSTTYTVDNYSSSVVFNKGVFVKDGLTPGEHTVKIEIVNSKNSSASNYYQVIDSIEVLNNPASKILTAGTYEEGHSAFNYVGNWIKEPASGYSKSSALISNTSGDYMTFKFNGTGIRWGSLSAASLGTAKVTIDSTTYTIDNYSSSTVFNKIALEKLSLSPGEHTVKIEVTNSKNVASSNLYQVIDYIEIIN